MQLLPKILYRSIGPLLVVIFVLTSCTLSPTTTSPTNPHHLQLDKEDLQFSNKQLTIAVFEGAYGITYWEEVIQRFEADFPGVQVTMMANPKIMEIIKPMNVSGNPPDFIYAPLSDESHTVNKMIYEEALLDLSDLFASHALDQPVPLRDLMMDDIMEFTKPYDTNNIYIAPLYITTEGLWYNKNLFKQKGWQPPRTWDEFWQLGELAKADGRHLLTYQGIYPGYLTSVLWSSIAANMTGNEVHNITHYEKGSFQTAAVRKTLSLFETIVDQQYLMPDTAILNHTQAQTEFLKGKALFIPNGNWFEGEMKDIAREEGFDFGYLPPPTFTKNDQQYTQLSFEAMFIPAKAKNKELAKLFLKYQYVDEIVKLNAQESTGIIALKNGAELAKPFIPASVYDSATIFNRGVTPVIVRWSVFPNTEIKIIDEIFNPISDMLHRGLSAEQAMDRVEKTFTNIREAKSKLN
ncbi:carbohydrate ABC transporter substrate-binding protein [Paenibacillus yanchengensis]|uniref:Carbohydrate ABC transporter substrate-binding protein n=1 Tax=Paenibacillus yanchengensis TaxID=2035833 RepID=A0ABW4YG27_9BACL